MRTMIAFFLVGLLSVAQAVDIPPPHWRAVTTLKGTSVLDPPDVIKSWQAIQELPKGWYIAEGIWTETNFIGHHRCRVYGFIRPDHTVRLAMTKEAGHCAGLLLFNTRAHNETLQNEVRLLLKAISDHGQ